jgi:ribonuclease P protein component
MSHRLERQVRLRARPEFTAVQEQGRRVGTTSMTVLARPNQLNRDRLGIIASRKFGRAVTRNRAKRRLRALFRGLEPDTVESRGYLGLDVVIIPRREFIRAPFASLERELAGALARMDPRRRR